MAEDGGKIFSRAALDKLRSPEITVKADGMGMIMDSAGIVNISHIRGGKVTEV